MRFRYALVALIALAGPAAAQAPPQIPQPPAAFRALDLSLQTITNSARLFVEDVQRSMDAKDAQIKELTDKCGDACKPPKASGPSDTVPPIDGAKPHDQPR